MAKAPKAAAANDAEPAPSDLIAVDVSVGMIDKARKHLYGRLRHIIATGIYSNGTTGEIARMVQDIRALDMIHPNLGDRPDPKRPEPKSIEDAIAEQQAAHDRHKRDEEQGS